MKLLAALLLIALAPALVLAAEEDSPEVVRMRMATNSLRAARTALENVSAIDEATGKLIRATREDGINIADVIDAAQDHIREGRETMRKIDDQQAQIKQDNAFMLGVDDAARVLGVSARTTETGGVSIGFGDVLAGAGTTGAAGLTLMSLLSASRRRRETDELAEKLVRAGHAQEVPEPTRARIAERVTKRRHQDAAIEHMAKNGTHPKAVTA